MTLCITNSVFALRSCVIRGMHVAHCDGWARRQVIVTEYDRITRKTTRTARTAIMYPDPFGHSIREREGIPCDGCVPREAESGHLCGFHGRQSVEAITRMTDVLTFLWSLNGSGVKDDNDRVQSQMGSRWTLSESRILANEIVMHAWSVAEAFAGETPDVEPPTLHPMLSPFAGFRSDASSGMVAAIALDLALWLDGHGEKVWARRRGAAAMIPFVQDVRRAVISFPTDDKPHRVPVLRCRNCNRLSLEWHPPLYFMSDDEIKCERCGHVEDRALLEHDMAVILEVNKKRRTS